MRGNWLTCLGTATLAWLINSTLGFATSIERPEKVSIIHFGANDLQRTRISTNGWHAGCPIKTQPFSLTGSYNVELEVMFDGCVFWEKSVASAEEIAEHALASFEINYLDHFGNMNFEPKMIRPHHVGRIRPLAKTEDGFSVMRGGALQEPVRIVLGPVVIPAGAHDVIVNVCSIAPDTTIEVKEIQVRMRPLN